MSDDPTPAGGSGGSGGKSNGWLIAAVIVRLVLIVAVSIFAANCGWLLGSK